LDKGRADAIRKLGETQDAYLTQMGELPPDVIGFSYGGWLYVHNPCMSVCGRWGVDPVKEYEADFEASPFMTLPIEELERRATSLGAMLK